MLSSIPGQAGVSGPLYTPPASLRVVNGIETNEQYQNTVISDPPNRHTVIMVQTYHAHFSCEFVVSHGKYI